MKPQKTTLVLPKRTKPQREISESIKRFNIACWGRQSGKTTFGISKMTYKPLLGRRDGIYWYVLQTHDAAEIGFNRHWKLLRDTDNGLLKRKPNESEKIIQLINGAQIFYKSGEVFEDLRAETLDGCIIDEMRQQKRDLWPIVIRPMLSRFKAWCDIYSTPAGFDHFYDLWQFAKQHPEEWGTFKAPSDEAWWWTKEELESAKATMSEAEFAQEIKAEFIDLTSGRAYQNFSDVNIKDQNPFAVRGYELSPYVPIVVGLDFNVNPMAWTLGQQINGDWYWFDEIWIQNTNTQECAQELINKVKGHETGVILCGDATGESRNTKATESDYAIIMNALRQANIRYENRTPDKNPPVKERVNTINAKLKDANGNAHMWIHSRCKRLIKDLQRVVWKQGAQVILDQTTDSLLTHSSDGIGYPVHAMSPITSGGNVGTLRIITR